MVPEHETTEFRVDPEMCYHPDFDDCGRTCHHLQCVDCGTLVETPDTLEEALGMSKELSPDAKEILSRIADILYPLNEWKGQQWNGGDVCEAVARLLDEYDPAAKDRQREEPDEGYEDFYAEYQINRD